LDCKEEAVPPEDGRNQQGQPTTPLWWKGKKSTDLIIAACTVALAITAILQWLVLRETISLTRNDQRAWMGPAQIGFPTIQPGSAPSATVLATNFGKTPALNVQKISCYRLLTPDERAEPEYKRTDPNPPSNSIFFPGEKQTFYATAGSPLAQSDVNDIVSGTKVLHLFVKLTYDDIFRCPHRTEFAQYLVRSPSDPSRFVWRVLNTHNTAD
jgi:hypothetical protein